MSTEQPKHQFHVRKAILPGMAAIAIFLLFYAMMMGFAIMHRHFDSSASKVGLLILCTLLLVGVLGLLRMKRWGWALVTGGCLCMSLKDIYLTTHTHDPRFMIPALLELCFFLYLIRTDVRERTT
ncbi:hypothetical protein ACFQBQ_09495 [Granulicella cerasi]|uniref:Uncharacterized protein n=1 Tax=Granulicella cerasi TaxID=741063 RepID=A0ABW1ZAA1_9BACT|nr:hypothetical protein [Granulicella cerasi]